MDRWSHDHPQPGEAEKRNPGNEAGKLLKRKRDSWIPECMWRVIYLVRYACFVNYLFLVVKISFPWSFSDLTNHHLWHLAQSVLWQSVTFEMFLSTSNPQFWACRKFEIKKKVTNGPHGTVASKTAKPVHLMEKGLNKLRINLAEVNPTHKIEQ